MVNELPRFASSRLSAIREPGNERSEFATSSCHGNDLALQAKQSSYENAIRLTTAMLRQAME